MKLQLSLLIIALSAGNHKIVHSEYTDIINDPHRLPSGNKVEIKKTQNDEMKPSNPWLKRVVVENDKKISGDNGVVGISDGVRNGARAKDSEGESSRRLYRSVGEVNIGMEFGARRYSDGKSPVESDREKPKDHEVEVADDIENTVAGDGGDAGVANEDGEKTRDFVVLKIDVRDEDAFR